MSSDARIRPATEADAPRLAGLATQLGYPQSAEDAAARLSSATRGGAVLVAEHRDAGVIGTVQVVAMALMTSGDVAVVAGLVVDRAHRGRGVGRALLDAAERWAASRGLAEVRIRARVERGRAHDFYEASGYTKDKTQHLFRKRVGVGAL